jgi:hypothetical protein
MKKAGARSDWDRFTMGDLMAVVACLAAGSCVFVGQARQDLRQGSLDPVLPALLADS